MIGRVLEIEARLRAKNSDMTTCTWWPRLAEVKGVFAQSHAENVTGSQHRLCSPPSSLHTQSRVHGDAGGGRSGRGASVGRPVAARLQAVTGVRVKAQQQVLSCAPEAWCRAVGQHL